MKDPSGAPTTPDIAVATAPRPGTNFAKVRTRVPKRLNIRSLSDTHESGSRLSLHMALNTRLPRRCPARYQQRSATRHAEMAAARIDAKGAPPCADHAPAMISNG